jgi:hypothetical protein
LGCASQPFPGDVIDTLSCTGDWPGDTISRQYTIHVETSTPTVSAVRPRPPDHNGWYNRPVTIAFGGTSFSGIASCTTTTYSGPNSSSATVTGGCTDEAGKTATTTTAPFAYDATPPSIDITAAAGDGVVNLDWAIADVAPIARVKILRSPGVGTARSSVVYSGTRVSAADEHVSNGVRYRYTIIASDVAGNASRRSIVVTPGPRLLAPAPGARLTAPLSLAWTPVRGASYYNAQLYRGQRKVLSTWPAHARLRLPASWSFDGHRYRLRPGRYRWYVWPGVGPRADARYGPLIGSRVFVITRPA